MYHQIFVQNYNFNCQPVDYSNTENGIIELQLVYSFFILKVLDLLDTVSDRLEFCEIFFNSEILKALHNPKEEQLASLVSPLLSSLLHGVWYVYGGVVDSRWTWKYARNGQHIRTWIYVLLLLFNRIKARTQTVDLVEKAHHTISNGSIIWIKYFKYLLHNYYIYSSNSPFWLCTSFVEL